MICNIAVTTFTNSHIQIRKYKFQVVTIRNMIHLAYFCIYFRVIDW
jgi:hypothetical protein